jgi:hypothetical protein
VQLDAVGKELTARAEQGELRLLDRLQSRQDRQEVAQTLAVLVSPRLE